MTASQPLTDHDSGLALDHAQALLRALGVTGKPCPLAHHPALAWRRSGLMALSGHPESRGLVCPVPLTSAADGALAALRALAPDALLPQNAAALLGERARLLGLSRHGAISANLSCRLLAARDGYVALNLPRADDWELLPALLEQAVDDWDGVECCVRDWASSALVARGRLMGMAIAESRAMSPPDAPFILQRFAPPRPRSAVSPVVLDLSSLWAGPLAASLLAFAGAEVVKVESSRRPDGARLGHAGFYALLNGMKESVSLDFRNTADLARLREMVDQADIVIEGSRPRALEQLGIRAETVAARGGTWVSITAHGRSGECAGHIGFGDDAAIAGGLGEAMRAGWGETLFAGDAIADPLAGITAALAGWADWWRGGGSLVAVSLAGVVAHACALPSAEPQMLRSWQAFAETDTAPLYPLRPSSSG
ncbi:CoA transferase [Novosphingobium sp.]|uniref:CoA transferase n=1 Tax=Novosphingobium sp. TaxID=1874826 RepID=UPI0026236664|nr:CoA transferase [Novosphingobium sp.]